VLRDYDRHLSSLLFILASLMTVARLISTGFNDESLDQWICEALHFIW
jgi:hypothetical protein